VIKEPCVCGKPSTVTVEVQWVDHKTRFDYCEDCANDVVNACEGAEILP